MSAEEVELEDLRRAHRFEADLADRLAARVSQLEGALRWYADEKIKWDNGETARDALEESFSEEASVLVDAMRLLLDEAERASLPMTDDGPPINYQLDVACKRARAALEGVARGH